MYTTGSTLDKADILLIEYTDLECPYCKRHHNNGTAHALLAKYPKTTYTIKHFPLSFHTKALSGAVASLCNAQNGKDYYAGIDSLFADLSFNPIPCSNISSLVARVNAEMKEGQDVFNVTGTPATVLINTKTKAYTVIA
jgi:protein-disulfide isomerase